MNDQSSLSQNLQDRFSGVHWFWKLLGTVFLAIVANMVANYIQDWLEESRYLLFPALAATGMLLLLGVAVFVALAIMPHQFLDRPFKLPFLNSLIGAGLLGLVLGSAVAFASLLPLTRPKLLPVMSTFHVYNYEGLALAILCLWLGFFVFHQSDVLALTVHTCLLAASGTAAVWLRDVGVVSWVPTFSGWFLTCNVAAAVWLVVLSEPSRLALKRVWNFLVRHR